MLYEVTLLCYWNYIPSAIQVAEPPFLNFFFDVFIKILSKIPVKATTYFLAMDKSSNSNPWNHGQRIFCRKRLSHRNFVGTAIYCFTNNIFLYRNLF